MAINPSGICQCGCGQQTQPFQKTSIKNGVAAGEPQRFVHGHQVRTRYGKSDFSKPPYTVDENGCWMWNHGTSTKGYAKIDGDYGHRVFYRRYYGDIPEGMVIDHLCFNRLCVNPCHLEAVSDSENKRREMYRRYRGLAPRYPNCTLVT